MEIEVKEAKYIEVTYTIKERINSSHSKDNISTMTGEILV